MRIIVIGNVPRMRIIVVDNAPRMRIMVIGNAPRMLIIVVHEGVMCRVRLLGAMSNPYQIEKGVKLGSVLFESSTIASTAIWPVKTLLKLTASVCHTKRSVDQTLSSFGRGCGYARPGAPRAS